MTKARSNKWKDLAYVTCSELCEIVEGTVRQKQNAFNIEDGLDWDI